MLLAPHLPLLFMGEEYGEERPFLFFCSFADADLVESIRVGRRQEFAAFHWRDCVGACVPAPDTGTWVETPSGQARGPSGPFPQEVPDPQAAATFAASCLTWVWAEDQHKAGLRRLYRDLLSVRRRWPALRHFSQCAARLLPGRTPQALLELVRGASHPEPGKTLQVYYNLTAAAQPFTPPSAPAEAVLFSSEAKPYAGARQATAPVEHLWPYECVVVGPAGWHSLVAE
jgi:maltooligosyltrehalose trehalohydrolase